MEITIKFEPAHPDNYGGAWNVTIGPDSHQSSDLTAAVEHLDDRLNDLIERTYPGSEAHYR